LKFNRKIGKGEGANKGMKAGVGEGGGGRMKLMGRSGCRRRR